MILILSTSLDDDTNVVIEHLNNLGERFVRLNDIDLFNGNTKVYYTPNAPAELIIENDFFGKVTTSDISVVWFRKWGNFYKYKEMLDADLSFETLQYLNTEYSEVLNLIIFSLRDKKWINHYTAVQKLSKIEMLVKAETAGLKIPRTVISNTMKQNDKSWITKSMSDGQVISHNGKNFPLMTVKYEHHVSSAFPGLFQEQIMKEYELRIFYLNGKNYPMAIFSQNDSQTSVDFRNYNSKKPNRFIRYQLPKDLDRNIKKLMKALRLETGSIDIIKATDGEYYFLEVNPSGQFRMTSYRCNYNLHFEMALLLKKMAHEKKSFSGN